MMRYTTDRLLRCHDMLSVEAKQIMAEKNRAYANEEDPFRNFLMCERAGVASAEVGLLVRIQDKLSRLITFANSGSKLLGNESYRDSITDIINYLVLFHGLQIWRNEQPKPEDEPEVIE